jgi:predicted RNase H-like HicB family nuclease
MRQVIIHPDPEDGGWIVEVPSLPGCVRDGDTREEAIGNMREAIDQWIDAAAQMGRAVPPESFETILCVV